MHTLTNSIQRRLSREDDSLRFSLFFFPPPSPPLTCHLKTGGHKRTLKRLLKSESVIGVEKFAAVMAAV